MATRGRSADAAELTPFAPHPSGLTRLGIRTELKGDFFSVGLVNFDRKKWFWSILAGKTGVLPSKLVLVGFSQLDLADFD